jgi:hypothetical protein
MFRAVTKDGETSTGESGEPMKPSYRTWFLIGGACLAFNLSYWRMLFILVGYGIAEYVDQRLAKKARDEIFEDVLYLGWKPSKEDPESEEKGNMERVRLTGQYQILAARIGELLVRMR